MALVHAKWFQKLPFSHIEIYKWSKMEFAGYNIK